VGLSLEPPLRGAAAAEAAGGWLGGWAGDREGAVPTPTQLPPLTRGTPVGLGSGGRLSAARLRLLPARKPRIKTGLTVLGSGYGWGRQGEGPGTEGGGRGCWQSSGTAREGGMKRNGTKCDGVHQGWAC